MATLLGGCVLLGPGSLSQNQATLNDILDKVTYIPILSQTNLETQLDL